MGIVHHVQLVDQNLEERPSTYDNDKLDFPREAEMLSDGTIMATDAGCMWVPDPSYECPGEIYFLKPESLPQSLVRGNWSKAHKTQKIVTLEEWEVSKEVICGFQLVFEADYLPPGTVGQEVRAALAAGGVPCSDQ